MHSLRSNWPGARREGGSVSPAILDRLSNEAPGQFQRNPEGGMSFERRRCCSLLTDPLRDMLGCPCGSTSRLASAQNPWPRMYSYFGDTTLAGRVDWMVAGRTRVLARKRSSDFAQGIFDRDEEILEAGRLLEVSDGAGLQRPFFGLHR